MQVIDKPLNPELLEILDGFTDWFFKQDRSLLLLNGEPDENEYYTSEEYHDSIPWDLHIGYPKEIYAVDMNFTKTTPLEWREKITGVRNKLNTFLCANFSAVMVYYPPGGFMSWHDNRNSPGYNILLSYNKTGNGFFRFKDKGQTVTVEDKPGWNLKVGYYGGEAEEDLQVRHCARSYEERLTFGMVIPHKHMWEMTVEEMVC